MGRIEQQFDQGALQRSDRESVNNYHHRNNQDGTYKNQFSAIFQSFQAYTALARLCTEYEGVKLFVLLLLVSNLDAPLQDVGERGPSSGEVVEDRGFFVKDDMEVPAAPERTDGRFDPKAFSGNDSNLDRTVGALRVGGGDTSSIEFLVGRVNHLVLDRELATT